MILNTLENIDCQLQEFKKSVSIEEFEVLLFEFKKSKEDILSYIGHLVRGYQQNLSKTKVFSNLKENQAIWIRHWAQKILPLEFREAQKNYFGKRGNTLYFKKIFLFQFS